ncbi:MAG: TRAP transporter large permease [Rubrivivax sp.]|nr:TRAP transporter large permease [Rubrivivax sp.]
MARLALAARRGRRRRGRGRAGARPVNPASPFAWAIYAIVALSLLGLPVGHAMLAGSILYLYLAGLDMGTAAEQLLNGMYTSYLLLAIPLFVLAAEFMNTGSIMDRLLRFCNAIVGRFRGGLAQVNVVQSIIFASMSGSALADAAGSGKLMQTMMTKDGRYTPGYAAALSAVSAVIGPIMPPSIPLVLYALVSNTSVGYLFLAGVVPGLLLGAVQLGLIAVTARRRGFPVEEKVPLRELPRVTWQAVPALLMPVILLGCLYSGVTTPTEAAAVAAAYALLISALLYRSVRARDIYGALRSSAKVTVAIGVLIAGAIAFNFVVTAENIPRSLSVLLAGYELSPLAFLLVVNVLLLALGCFLEGTTIILVILPVLLPTVQALGIDPVHFGIVAVVNIMLGLVTPPYGLLLFMMTKVANVPLAAIVREVLPFLWVMIGALAVITLFPDLVLALPRLLGYTG